MNNSNLEGNGYLKTNNVHFTCFSFHKHVKYPNRKTNRRVNHHDDLYHILSVTFGNNFVRSRCFRVHSKFALRILTSQFERISNLSVTGEVFSAKRVERRFNTGKQHRKLHQTMKKESYQICSSGFHDHASTQ